MLAVLDTAAGLVELRALETDEDILAAVPDGACIAVDAPLVVPNEDGARDVERLLGWLDIPTFPNSRRRLHALYGGARGEEIRPALAARTADLVESVPDATLRQLMLETARGTGAPPLELAEYRAAWLGVRAPRYRPRGAGRGHPDGCLAAAALLAGVVDLGGWAPGSGDDWQTIRSAAALDAIACAYTALRAREPRRALRLGTPERGEVLLASDETMRRRAEVNLERLRAEGRISI